MMGLAHFAIPRLVPELGVRDEYPCRNDLSYMLAAISMSKRTGVRTGCERQNHDASRRERSLEASRAREVTLLGHGRPITAAHLSAQAAPQPIRFQYEEMR